MLYRNTFFKNSSPPFTDRPPLMVFPDTHDARNDVEMKSPQERELITFCPHFVPDHAAITPRGYAEVKQPCKNRVIENPAHNWCYRCMAGYPVSYRRLT